MTSAKDSSYHNIESIKFEGQSIDESYKNHFKNKRNTQQNSIRSIDYILKKGSYLSEQRKSSKFDVCTRKKSESFELSELHDQTGLFLLEIIKTSTMPT